MEPWRVELRELFSEEPKAAERILRALDEGKFKGSSPCGCAYGHGVGEGDMMRGAQACLAAERRYRCNGLTPLEKFAVTIGSFYENAADYHHPELRAECIAWLSMHGTATEPLGHPQLVEV